MSTSSSKNNVLEDDDDDQDYIPVGVLQVSSFRPPPASLEHVQNLLPPPSDDLSSYHAKQQQQQHIQHVSIPSSNLNHPQFEQLRLEDIGQDQSRFKKNDVDQHQTHNYQHDIQKNDHFQHSEKEDAFRKSNQGQEESQETLPQYKLLLQIMQQQQRAEVERQGVNNNQTNQNPIKFQAKIRTSSFLQSNSTSEHQRQTQKVSREDLNSNVPLESHNQLLKILTLAQRDQETGQKPEHNSSIALSVNSTSEIPSCITQGSSVKQNIPSYVEKDGTIASKSALRIDISPSYQHIPRSYTDHPPQQSPTSSTAAGFHPYHPNVNHHHPEITKRLNSPVSPGRQSTSPRQAVSPRHTGGSPRQVSNSPCQFISPKQPASPRGTTVNSRKSQPSSPQPFHHPSSPKIQSGFSWQPQQPLSSSSTQIVPARRYSASSNSQDLPSPVSQFPNPINSLTTPTQEASAENIHGHPSRFQPIPSAMRRRTLSGGVVHHRAPVETLPTYEFNISPSITSSSSFIGDSALSVPQTTAISQHNPPFSHSSDISVSRSQQHQPDITDRFDVLTSTAHEQYHRNSAKLASVPSYRDSFIQKGNNSLAESSTCVTDSLSHLFVNQKLPPESGDSESVFQNTLSSSELETKGLSEKSEVSVIDVANSENHITAENESDSKSLETVCDDGGVVTHTESLDESDSTQPVRKVDESLENLDTVKVKRSDKKPNSSKDSKEAMEGKYREIGKADDSENTASRETSSKRLRKPKVPFEDSTSASGKVKKSEKTEDNVSHGKSTSKDEKYLKEKKGLKNSLVHKQSVLTRSSLRQKGNQNSKMQKLKRSDVRDSRGQFINRSLRGSDLRMKSNRYILSRKVNKAGKESDQKEEPRNSVMKDSEKNLRNGNKIMKETKQEQKKGSEFSTAITKGKIVKDNKDHKEGRRGSESGSGHGQKKENNGKESKNDQKKSQSGKEQRRGSDASSKKPDKELRLNTSKESSSVVDSEMNTRSSSRLIAKQSGNPDDKNKNSCASSSRSRSGHISEPTEDSKLSQNERVSTRGSKVQESPVSSERVTTRASKSHEPIKESKSVLNGKIVGKDPKHLDPQVELTNCNPNLRVSTRGSKSQESSSAESNSLPKDKTNSKVLQSQDASKETNSNLTRNERVATRGLKSHELTTASAEPNSNERVSTRSTKTPSQVPFPPDKTVTRGMTTRKSDGTKSTTKRLIESTDSPSPLPRKRTKSEDGHVSAGNEMSKKSEARSTRSKSGSQKIKHDFKNSDEDEEYNVEDDEGEDSSDDRISPTTTRSGRVTSAPKRKITMSLRHEARKKKYNIEDESISDESNESEDEDNSESDDQTDHSESESGSDTDSKVDREGRYPSSKGEKRLEALIAPKEMSDVKEDKSCLSDLSKMLGFKLVPLTQEEMSETPGKDSMLPMNGFILPGTNCILLPAHFTQYIKTENDRMSTSSAQSSTQSISQAPTRVLATPRPISSVSESSSMKPTAFNSPTSSSSTSSFGPQHPYHAGLRGPSVVPPASTPPPAVSLSSSSSSTRIASTVSSSNPWNSPSLPTPPPSVSSSSSHSSSSWNPVANLQPWMSDGSTPGATAWNNEPPSATNNEVWRSNNSNNNHNNAYLSRGSYGDHGLALSSDVLPMHDPASQRLHHDIPGSGQDPLYIGDRVSSSSPPVEANLFRDASNLSPSGYNNIALPGLGQQDISYLESKLQQEMDMSSMLLSEVPYEDEIPEPVPAVHHGIPVCSVNLDDADVGGGLGNVTSTLHLPGGNRSLENVNMTNMQSSQQQSQSLQQQQPQPQQPEQTGFLEELMSEHRVETAVSSSTNVMQKDARSKTDEASPNLVRSSGDKSIMNTKKHLYEVIIKDDKKYGKCRICNGSFSLSSIYRHLKKHEDPSAGIFCTICGKKYSQKHNLVTHMKRIHNAGTVSHTGGQEEEKIKEESEQIPKPEQGDSLDSLPVEKSAIPLSSAESDSQIESKDETKDGKKKQRKRSVDRKYTKDGLVYELMPESPNPINTRIKRKTQRQVERVRRMKAKKKLEAGKNINGITYELSKLDAYSSDDEYDEESEEEEVDEKKVIVEKDSSSVDAGERHKIEQVKVEEKVEMDCNDQRANMADSGDVVMNEAAMAAVSLPSTNMAVSALISASTSDSCVTNVSLSSNIKPDNQDNKTESQSSDSSKQITEINPSNNVIETADNKELSAATTDRVEEQMESAQGAMGEIGGDKESDTTKNVAVTAESTSNPSPTKEKYPCSLCSSVLASKCSYFLHMKRHRSVKDKVCNYCGKGFITGQELRSHERTHTGERPYTCEICKYTFAHQGSYQAHKKGHAKRGETVPFPPEKCYNEGLVQQPIKRKKRAASEGVGPESKRKEDSSASSTSDISGMPHSSVSENVGSGNVNFAQKDSSSRSSSSNMPGQDSMMRRRSLESSNFSQQQAFDPLASGGGGKSGMRPPTWPQTHSGSGISWDNRRPSSEQQQQDLSSGMMGNVGQHQSSTTNFRDQSSPSFYSPSPTHYGSSSGTDGPMMSPNVCYPANQVTAGISQHNKYPSQSSPHQHPNPQQRFPTPHTPHVPHNPNAMKSPTHEPNFPVGSPNQLYSSASGSNLDDGRLFASPGPPPPMATLVNPRKPQHQQQQQHHQQQQQQHQQKQHMPHPPQNYSPSQQFGMYGPSSSANSSPNSYSQPVQHQLQQQQHHHHQQLPHATRQQQQEQYNIPQSSFSGTTAQGVTPVQTTQQQRQQLQQQQVPSPYHNPHHHQGVSQQQQQQYHHQFRQSPGLQQQHQQLQKQLHHHPQPSQQQSQPQHQQQQQHQSASGQHNLQQQFTPPPPYNPNQSKPPPPYPASYNEFYRSPQHGDESQQQQPQPLQQSPRIQSPSMHQHTGHQSFSNPSYTNSTRLQQTSSSPQSATPVNRPANQTVTANNSNRSLSSPATIMNTNNNFNQPVVRSPSGPQINQSPSILPSSPSMNTQQQQQQQQTYHHHPSPSASSTPSPGYFHQGPSPSSSG